MGRFKIAIVIPAYNEEDTIRDVVDSVLQYGSVIVVNDASSDSTESRAIQSGAIVVNHVINQGYDKALNSGFIEADKRDYDAIITFDADGQHNPIMMEEYIKYLKNGKELVLGVRPKSARIVERVFAVYTRAIINWKDPLCGMKGYSMKLYRKQGYFDLCKSTGTELAIFALKNGYPSVQLSVPITKRQDSPRFYSAVVSNFLIIKSLFNVRNL